jgi:hypothetical protein
MTNRESLSELELAIRPFDALLKPIASSKVDISDPAWVKNLERLRPLEAAGIPEDEAHALLVRILERYELASNEERHEIRGLFERYRAFAWAIRLAHRPTTQETFRQHLLRFSVANQGRDSRDAILWLQGLCLEATRAGVNVRPVLAEVAMLSSDENKYGMGSTRELLRREEARAVPRGEQ